MVNILYNIYISHGKLEKEKIENLQILKIIIGIKYKYYKQNKSYSGYNSTWHTYSLYVDKVIT